MPCCLWPVCLQARKALADRQKDLEVKTQQLEIKLSNKTEEDIKKARRKSTQAGQGPECSRTFLCPQASNVASNAIIIIKQ